MSTTDYTMADIVRPDGTGVAELQELRTRVALAEAETSRLLRASYTYSRGDFRTDAKRCYSHPDVGRELRSHAEMATLPINIVVDVGLLSSVPFFWGGCGWNASLQRLWWAADHTTPGVDRLFAEYLVEVRA